MPTYDLVIFDLDGTLIAHREPIWKTLHQHFGSDPERRKQLVMQGLAGTISYDDWFAGDLELLQAAGATRAAIMDVVRTMAPTTNASALVAALHESGCKVAVVSGGIRLILDELLPECRFDAVYINQMFFDAAGNIDGGKATPYDLAAKADALEALAERFGTRPARVAFVGDGNNDHTIMERAGLGIAWGAHAPATLVDIADHHVTSGNMMDLSPLLLPRL